MSLTKKIIAATIILQLITLRSAVAAPDAAFTQFIAALWPEAQAAGVARAPTSRKALKKQPK